jgi:hypothetical protein
MTKRLLLLAAALAPLALAGCGPDCDAFCDKLQDCAVITAQQRDQCVNSCDDVGGDSPALIECVDDKSCEEIRDQGNCFLPQVQ